MQNHSVGLGLKQLNTAHGAILGELLTFNLKHQTTPHTSDSKEQFWIPRQILNVNQLSKKAFEGCGVGLNHLRSPPGPGILTRVGFHKVDLHV